MPDVELVEVADPAFKRVAVRDLEVGDREDAEPARRVCIFAEREYGTDARKLAVHAAND